MSSNQVASAWVPSILSTLTILAGFAYSMGQMTTRLERVEEVQKQTIQRWSGLGDMVNSNKFDVFILRRDVDDLNIRVERVENDDG